MSIEDELVNFHLLVVKKKKKKHIRNHGSPTSVETS